MSFIKNGLRQKISRLEMSVPFPPKSDLNITVSITPIAESSGTRRAANGDMVNTARSVFKKYKISISGEDMIPPGIQSLWNGDYIEIVVPDFMFFNADSVSRVSLDAHEVLPDGQKANPDLFMRESDYTTSEVIGGLQKQFSAARVDFLRAPGSTSIPGAYAIRCRPVFACTVIGWGTNAVEGKAATSWTLELEER